tara:strand:+ start:456 stop:710 length:255 start_codon:yes stop_codon:yes gene_type:complete
MINKQISLGTLITILTIIGTFIYTQGITSNKIESSEIAIQDNSKKIKTNSNKTQNLEIGQERIETKIDGVMSRFDRLETLIMEM